MTSGKQPRGLGWWNVGLILVVFAAPVVAAWVLYYHYPELARSLGTTNYGKFVHPARTIGLVDKLAGFDQRPLSPDFFSRKWTYVYIERSGCDARCQGRLYQMRQVRLTQGENMRRVQRLFVVVNPTDHAQLKSVLAKFPGMTVALAQGTDGKAFVDQFKVGQGPGPAEARRLYLVDARGRLMMYYPPVAKQADLLADATGMRKDLAKLLKDHPEQ